MVHGMVLELERSDKQELRNYIFSTHNDNRQWWFRDVDEFVCLTKTLKSDKLYFRTKCTIYKTLMRLVVLYGQKTWIMLEKVLQAKVVLERRGLEAFFWWWIMNNKNDLRGGATLWQPQYSRNPLSLEVHNGRDMLQECRTTFQQK